MTPLIRTAWRRGDAPDVLVAGEWLATNGLGGYASGTLGGAPTRRFHGVLVAALGAARGRTMVMSRFAAELVFRDGTTTRLEGIERLDGGLRLPESLAEVRFEAGLPVWRYEELGATLEKRVVVPHARNTALVTWRLLAADGTVVLRVRPELHVRPHEGRVDVGPDRRYETTLEGRSWQIDAGGASPPITLRFAGPPVRSDLAPSMTPDVVYAEERRRGYDSHGPLFSPGAFEATLSPGDELAVLVTVEDSDRRGVLSAGSLFTQELARRAELLRAADACAREGLGADLVLAADAFVIRPSLRDEGASTPRAEGDRARTIVAGYPWFTDWGRDTMISLEGLCLVTGRHEEAGAILRLFARHTRDGLIPNLFPEGANEGLYHTADASLWFFHALDRYARITGDRATVRQLLPTLRSIVRHHDRGTRFGIRVTPDGLLTQGADGYQLTWMDAKVGDWVVTPRRGKAVEINALWFNALSVLGQLLSEEGFVEEAAIFSQRASHVRDSFNRRFWCETRGHLYDVVDGPTGDDSALRPNQIFAISLPNPVLAEHRWARVLAVVERELLTPRGLRSLGPGEVDFKKTYDGDLHARDAAYHQGTVWAWLAGPFVDALLRVRPNDPEGPRRLVEAFAPHLAEACIGSIGEIFDADAPYTPRGCVAQAWSVAEVLRGWVRVSLLAGRSGP